MGSTATVALLVHEDRAEAFQLASETVSWLEERGHRARLLLADGSGQIREDGSLVDLSHLDLTDTKLAVSLGGDGTFLRLIPPSWRAGVPVLGVNFGRLGYLLELRPEQLLDALGKALAGEVSFEERAVLEISLVHDPEGSAPGERRWLALNEFVLEKTVFGHTVRLATKIDGEDFMTYSADGLLVATPSGSTAYNLSAGGPVVSPRLRAMVLTPVAPHLSLDRSLVLDPTQVLTVSVLEGRAAALVIDGQDAGRLAPGSVVDCTVADRPVLVATVATRGFGGVLRDSLVQGRE